MMNRHLPLGRDILVCGQLLVLMMICVVEKRKRQNRYKNSLESPPSLDKSQTTCCEKSQIYGRL